MMVLRLFILDCLKYTFLGESLKTILYAFCMYFLLIYGRKKYFSILFIVFFIHMFVKFLFFCKSL